MIMQYAIVGGQLHIDKVVFAREVLTTGGPLKKLMKTEETDNAKPPLITKNSSIVSINYNEASDIPVDEGFYDLLKQLKNKYREKIAGRVVIRITALTSYHVILDLNTEDGRIVYE